MQFVFLGPAVTMSKPWKSRRDRCGSAGGDPWHVSGDPWMSTTASSGGEEMHKTNYSPHSAHEIVEKMACRVGRAFRLANADLYRIDCTEFNSEISGLADVLGQLGRKIRPHLGKSQEAVHLLDLLATLAISRQGCDASQKQDVMKVAEPRAITQELPAKGIGKGIECGVQGKGIFVPPPLIQTVEKIVEVPMVQEVVKYITCEKIVEVPKIEYVPQVQVIEKIVEIEKILEIEKVIEVEKLVEAPSCHFAVQANESTIVAELALSAPEAEHRFEYNHKVAAHEAKHPNGTLPRELRGFTEYMKDVQRKLDNAEQAHMKCLSCGKFPWT